jgi:hypothetical protein
MEGGACPSLFLFSVPSANSVLRKTFPNTETKPANTHTTYPFLNFAEL